MRLQNKIVWAEGMFLQPQHFQQQDRYVESLITQRSRMISPWSWGITEFKLDESLLNLGKISIEICRGILPDGTTFDIPGRDRAPLPLDVPPGTCDCVVYLAIHLHRSGIPEVTGSNIEIGAFRYRAETIELDDQNTGGVAVPVQLAKLSLRLILDTDDREGFCCLGLLRIAEAQSDRQIIIDEEFIPTVLILEASKVLSGLVHEIQGLLNYRGNRLSQRVIEAGAGGVSEITDFLLLQLVNKYELLFQHFQQQPQKHPQLFYEILLKLIGEFSTFTQLQRRPKLVSEYLHHDLETTFSPLIFELRRSLSIVLEESAVSIQLEKQSTGLWVVSMFDRYLLKKSIFVLAVHANLPDETIRCEFPVQAKIAPLEEVRNLVNRALPGITLQALPVVPRQIPYHANCVYFALDRTHELWQKLEKSAGIAFHLSGEFSGIRLELWAVKDKQNHE